MPLPPGEIRWTVWFVGRVQGVGFRYSVRRVAERFAVRGYVRNLPDGRVELVAEGTETELAALLAAIEAEMPGHIRDRQIQPSPGTGEFLDFRVRF